MNEQIEYDVYEDAFYENVFHQETKFHDHNRADEETQNSNFVKTHFFTKLVQSYRCRFYNVDFIFNNQLHKHLRFIYNKFKSSTIKVIVINFKSINKFITTVIVTAKTLSSITFHTSKIVYSNVINVTIKEYAFREHRFVITLMIFILAK